MLYKCSKELQISGQEQKGEKMNKEMNLSELFKEVTEENTIRKILMILENCKDLEEAKEKIKDLLK